MGKSKDKKQKKKVQDEMKNQKEKIENKQELNTAHKQKQKTKHKNRDQKEEIQNRDQENEEANIENGNQDQIEKEKNKQETKSGEKQSKGENLEKFQNFIAEKRKLPKELIEKLSKKVFYNLVMAIMIMMGLIALNIVYFQCASEEFSNIAKIVAMTCIVLDIIVFEIAYRKDSGTYAITGVELLVLSIITLFIPRAYFYETYNTKLLLMSSSILFAIYYVIKCIVVYKKYNIDHINQLSDVKEIVQEETESYIEEIEVK